MKRTKPQSAVSDKKPKLAPHWANGLLAAMEDPDLKVKEDSVICVIKDKFPKAKHHFLILPKEEINSLKNVGAKHLSLLQKMEKAGLELAETYKSSSFKIGYHAQASMQRLHLHVISDDMDSPCLKTKKHWNSFITEFFVSSEDVVKSLEQTDKVVLPGDKKCKEWMDMPLKCHKCDYTPKNMPDLKKHIIKHIKL